MGNDEAQAVVIFISVIIYFIILGVPLMQIIHKAGYSRAWILILFVPLVNLIMLWIFAFAKWPSLQQAQMAQAYGYGNQQYPQGAYQQPGYPPQYQGGQYQQGGQYPQNYQPPR